MYYSICDDVKIRNFKLEGNKSILIRILEPAYKENSIPYTINNIDEYTNILEEKAGSGDANHLETRKGSSIML